jgi:hypothetical protein
LRLDAGHQSEQPRSECAQKEEFDGCFVQPLPPKPQKVSKLTARVLLAVSSRTSTGKQLRRHLIDLAGEVAIDTFHENRCLRGHDLEQREAQPEFDRVYLAKHVSR